MTNHFYKLMGVKNNGLNKPVLIFPFEKLNILIIVDRKFKTECKA